MAGRAADRRVARDPRRRRRRAGAVGGATVLAARGLTEGTEVRDAIALTEAAERLGASLHAEAGWDATSAGLDVPASRLAARAGAPRRGRPPAVVPRGRGRAPARRAADRPAPGQGRPAPARRRGVHLVDLRARAPVPPARRAARRETVAALTPVELRAVHDRAVRAGTRGAHRRRRRRPGRGRCGLAEAAVRRLDRADGDGRRRRSTTRRRSTGALVRVVHRPGAVQTEIRIGHPGLPRRNPDFHAVSVMGAILGGLFNSRLNMNLREEKGYTYGAGAGFDLRRARGPFTARAAVNTEVTIPALGEFLGELDRIRAGARHRGRAPRRARLPRRRLPAPVRDAGSGRRVARRPVRPRPAARRARRATATRSRPSPPTTSCGSRARTSTRIGPRSCSSATTTRSGRRSTPRASGPSRSSATRSPCRSRPGDAEDLAGPVDAGEGGPTEGAEDPDLPGSDEPSDPGTDDADEATGAF